MIHFITMCPFDRVTFRSCLNIKTSSIPKELKAQFINNGIGSCLSSIYLNFPGKAGITDRRPILVINAQKRTVTIIVNFNPKRLGYEWDWWRSFRQPLRINSINCRVETRKAFPSSTHITNTWVFMNLRKAFQGIQVPWSFTKTDYKPH